MKRFLFLLLLISLIPGAMADNVTNMSAPVPVYLSFMGGHAFGENPIQIIDNSTGAIVFIGNTSSRNISLQPDRGYYLRVEPAGLSDAANSPDAAGAGLMDYVRRNPIGVIAFTIAIVILLARLRRK
jgi:hypothetical protein